MGPEDLDAILKLVPREAVQDDRVLVGHDTHDDAGVYRLADTMALVQSIDFFTPVVDDPFVFGRIAAVNALSDIYAMGAKPLTALNLLATPAGVLDPELVSMMLRGGQSVMEEAGVAIIGGHTIDDLEPKMGYAVTGLVHPDHIWRNSTARRGDRVFLTKPIGTGVVVKAIKDGAAEAAWEAAAADMMTALNKPAQEAIAAAVGDPSACTDVTGFGLLGHLWEMAQGASVRIAVWEDRVPLLLGSERLAIGDGFPAGSRRNWEFVAPHLHVSGEPNARLRLLADAVTSGGLLFTIAPERVGDVERVFHERDLSLWAIGEVVEGSPGIDLRTFSTG